jgi:hypothetical protein
MKKIIRLKEGDLTRIVRRVITEESLNPEMIGNDFEMSGTRRRGEFTPTDREQEIQGVFGAYSEDIPPAVIRYMRKNPDKIVKRLYDIYGEKIYDYISDYSQGEMEGPLDEAETETVERTRYDKSEIDQAKQKGIGIDVQDGTVTPEEDGGMTVTRKK